MVVDALSHSSSAASTLTVAVVQVPDSNPFGEFLSGSAPSCLVPPFPVSTMQPLSSASHVDFFVLFSLQLSCPETTALLSNPSLRVVSMPYGDSSVLCDLSPVLLDPLVPVFLRQQVFDALHNLSPWSSSYPETSFKSICLVWPLQGCLRLGQRLSALSVE